MDNMICVGAFAGSYGVHGEVRLKSFTAVPEDIEAYGALSTEDGAQQYQIELTRQLKNAFAAKVSGVLTKEQADGLRGTKLYVSRDSLPSLPDDEFYHTDLVGLEVYDTGGTLLGRVKSVMNHGASDLLEIHGPGLKSTVLLPFTQEAVPTVDLTTGRIIADPPEGLFS